MSMYEEVKRGHPSASTIVCGVGIWSPKNSGNADFSQGGQPGESQTAVQVLGSWAGFQEHPGSRAPAPGK